jgi:hypothetical protein
MPGEPSLADDSATIKGREAATPLQWFREIVTAGIGLVVLALTATMLYGTWQFARTPQTGADAAAQKEAYDRQKDLMLYALSLLGTVTGYYLGRVPAELHAQQAQRAATSAQQQLQTTQTKLTDTASTAAVAATQASTAQAEKQQALQQVSEARNALENVSSAMSDAIAGAEQEPRATLRAGEEPAPSFGVSASAAVEDMRRAKNEIDRVIQQMRGLAR